MVCYISLSVILSLQHVTWCVSAKALHHPSPKVTLGNANAYCTFTTALVLVLALNSMLASCERTRCSMKWETNDN